MIRLSTITLITIAVAGIAAPVPRDAQKPVLYFPTTVGTRWVYDCDGKEQVEEVSDVIVKDGTFVVSFGDVVDDHLILEREYHVSKQGIFCTRDIFGERKCPKALLRLPSKPGDQWGETFLGGQMKNVETVGAIDDVEVPAGKFHTIRVESTVVIKGKAVGPKTTTWYAPDIGVVKEQVQIGSKILKTTKVLKSFTPGKK